MEWRISRYVNPPCSAALMIANISLKPAVTRDKSPWLAAILSVMEAPSTLSSRHNAAILRGSHAKKQNVPVRRSSSENERRRSMAWLFSEPGVKSRSIQETIWDLESEEARTQNTKMSMSKRAFSQISSVQPNNDLQNWTLKGIC